VRPFEQILDLGGKPDPMSQFGSLELDVHDLCSDQNLSPVPAVADRMGQHHCPGRHEGGTALLRGVLGRQSMRQQVAGAQADLLCADR